MTDTAQAGGQTRAPRLLSRRSMLAGAGGGVVAAGLHPVLPRLWLPPAHAAEPTLQLDLTRREDMLRLRLDFYNLVLDTSGDVPLLVVQDATAASQIVVTFPSQHLMEQTVHESETEPGAGNIASQAVGDSRIAFLVPRTVKQLPFTAEGLLDWRQFTLAVVPAANLTGSDPTEPGELQTDLLLTDWLHLSPDRYAAWAHAVAPVTHNGRTELWHTRLMNRGDDGRPDPAAGVPTVRAVFTDEEVVPDGPFKVFNNDNPELIVRQSLKVGPARSELLLLSAMGSSLELEAEWEATGDPDLDVLEKWIHRSHLGRDNYVRVVERGFLFPFGNRAVRDFIAERKFGVDGTPYLVTKSFIVVREPVKEYPTAGQDSDRSMPFRSIRITTTVTPTLPPDPQPEVVTGGSFWVRTGEPAEDLPFTVIGTDWAGQQIKLSCPMAFIRIDDAGSIGALIDEYGSYDDLDDDERRARPLGGQKVAFAESAEPGDTTFPAGKLYLGVKPTDGAPATQPSFYPVMLGADVRLPAVEATAPGAGPAVIGYDPAYVGSGFSLSQEGDAGLFARVQNSVQSIGEIIHHVENDPGGTVFNNAVGAAFDETSDKAGGIATPNLNIGGLSRAFGPVSGSPDGITDFATGGFDPADFFPDDAQLLGGVKLLDVINDVLGQSEGNGGPTIVAKTIHPDNDQNQPPTAVAVTLDWEPPLRDNENVPLEPKGPTGKDARLTLHGEFRTELASGTSTSEITGELTDFTLHLVTREGDLGFIKLAFNKFGFEVRDSAKPSFDVQLARVDFAGPLEFVNELREFLSTGGTGPNIDLQPTSISAGFTLAIPTTTVGVFTLQNISFSAGIRLPFDGGPVTGTFGFASRENPFIVTYLIFGGGGYFLLEVGSDGLHMLEAALEFGGSLALDIVVASGHVTVVAGIFLRLEQVPLDEAEPDGEQTKAVTLAGYVRISGRLSILGLISISVELELRLEYNFESGVLAGEASLKVKVEVLFFSKTVEVRVRKEFGGSASTFALTVNGSPEFSELISQDDWNTYCDAFAA